MSHYTIDVSQNGCHVFATAEHSLRDLDEAKDMAKDFQKRFPASGGFDVKLHGVKIVSERISLTDQED